MTLLGINAILRAGGAWLIGTKAGRVLLAIIAGLIALQAFASWERGIGREQAQHQAQQRDHQTIERAEDAERDARRDGDLSRSLRDGTF